MSLPFDESERDIDLLNYGFTSFDEFPWAFLTVF
jgi:hypothetical protein